jgi:hypothetical protein
LHVSRLNPYFALAFANAGGGLELRNPYFKGTHGTKDITLIDPPAASGTLAVFEGFMDFLSALALNYLPPGTSVLVLNSTAMGEKAVHRIKERSPAAVHLYLDHDPAGRDLTAYFKAALSGLAVVDQSGHYAGHKDVNAQLMAAPSRQSSLSFH